ncbi:MAG: hypothetical protein CM1200mP1_00590 [Candidatus Neomarinimicrobiota bacterium]|nr:MAG: hypothetical protein CM1200mP1_00590 [Candidatus Neomarinimicrobiota bacterium]
MILSGYNCEHQANVEEVAQRTLECLTNHVPNDVPGIAFLSGGQSDEDATLHLNAMNKSEQIGILLFLMEELCNNLH